MKAWWRTRRRLACWQQGPQLQRHAKVYTTGWLCVVAETTITLLLLVGQHQNRLAGAPRRHHVMVGAVDVMIHRYMSVRKGLRVPCMAGQVACFCSTDRSRSTRAPVKFSTLRAPLYTVKVGCRRSSSSSMSHNNAMVSSNTTKG